MPIESKFGIRHVQAILIFFSCYSITCLKPCFDMIILDMARPKNDSDTLSFHWDKKDIGMMNSSGFWGDMVAQILVCPIIYKYGGKPFIAFALSLTGIIQLLLPTLAFWADWKGMCAGFVLQGLSAGMVYPAMQTLIGKWAPYNERTRIGIFIYSGLYISSIIAYSLTPWISSNFGWQSAFYFYGIQLLVCFLLWMIFGSSSPAEHKTISEKEKRYIQSSLEETSQEIPKAPWKEIFTSKPFIILLITNIGAEYSYTVITTEITQYFNFAVGFDIQDVTHYIFITFLVIFLLPCANTFAFTLYLYHTLVEKCFMSGLYTSLTYTITLIFSFVCSWLCDFALEKKYFSLTVIRKLANTIGSCGPAIFLAILTFIPIANSKTIIFFSISIAGLDSLNSCGYVLNYVDLSPNYASILMCISTLISDIFSMMAPQLSGYIVDDITDIKKWRIVFLITAGIYFLSNLLFVLFGTAKTQKWNNINNNEDKENIDLNEVTMKLRLKSDLD